MPRNKKQNEIALPLKQKYSISRDYFIFASVIIGTIIALSIGIGFMIYKSNIQDQWRILSIDAEQIEQMISEDFDYTNRISIYMGKQIAEQNPLTPEFIYNLFQKTSGTQYKTKNLFSWSLFDWVDSNNLQIVNSQNGISKIPPDMSEREYTVKSRLEPWTLQVSKPAIGKPSGKWVIPAATGIVDGKGKYLGAIAVGFNVEQLVQQLTQVVAINHISYVILDTEYNIIAQSLDNITAPQSDYYKNIFSNQNIFQHVSGKLPKIESGDIVYQHYRKMENHPYIVLTGFNKYYTNKIFYSNLLPRLSELIGMGVFFLVLLYIFRRYVVSPITQLSMTADQISRGEPIKKVPRTSNYETTNLARQLVNLQRYIQRIHLFDKKLMRAKQEAEQANNAKSDFMAHMSHELRTPLNSIIGYSEVIKAEIFGPIKNEKYVEYANDICASGNQLLSLINDILDISKADSNQFEIYEQTVNLTELIEEITYIISETAKKKNITIQKNLPAIPCLMLADKRRMKQIVLHIISNAIKFSHPNNSISITLRNDYDISLSFSDSGIGIDKQHIPIILGKLGMAKSALSRQSEGSGIGIWLTKALVEAHNGTLSIESDLGKGTTVNVSFPRNRVINDNFALKAA
ncbi:MAG: Signal transduction histidine kinase [Rickettsiaceae bacterium]|jgi:signal transduction histidine kinase|nr:Signal transduction histidine kinase [Rickettsiaceae bacterium]